MRPIAYFPLTLVAVSLLTGCFETFKKSYTDDSALVSKLDEIMEENEKRIQGFGEDRSAVPASKAKPGKSDIWWQNEVAKSLKEGSDREVSVEELFVQTIQNSTQIKVFTDIPLIRETGIQEARGAFDTVSFVEAKYEYNNDPIGNLLETGFSQGRFIQNAFTGEAGLRKKLVTGTEVGVSQEVGILDNNSEFLVPNPQGSARLKITVLQPLLRGAGVAYNRAILDIAKIDSEAAMQELVRQSENHLLEVSRAYWGLYLARATYLQKKRLYDQAVKVAEEVKARGSVDAVKGQVARAESAIASRRSDLVRSELAIANAQDRIRALVNSPDLAEGNAPELIPVDSPMMREYPINYPQAAKLALAKRPEINQAFLQVRAAAVREKMQKNEVLPALNLLLEGYIAGLSEDGNFAQAWANQYNQGGPGAAAGFQFEFPLENNEAKARYTRRRIELRQQLNQLKTTIETALLEVKVSAREVRTAWRDYSAKLESVRAAQADLAQFQARREVDVALPGENQAASPVSVEATTAYLDSILSAQNRLTLAEEEFARSASTYQVAILNFERSQGNLLEYENISIVRSKDDKKLPLLELQKNTGGKVVPVQE